MEAGGSSVAFHLRGPGTSGRRLWEIGNAIRPAARREGVNFLVNDRVDLALVLAAEGAHLGERSLRTEDARSILGPGAVVGRSVHDADGARAECKGRTPADFLVAGPVFPTPSHPERAGIGLDGFARIVAAAGGRPVLAIGGVRSETVGALLAHGAYGVALIRGVWDAENVAEAIRLLGREIARAEEDS
jgi:thiamine-phosphate pyrophosphorylase